MTEDFGSHEVADYIRKDLPQCIEAVLPDSTRYKVVGSPGKGNWTKGPWAAVLDRTITDSAQRGYYIVYLFKEDMSGVYLSLNQGVTDILKQYARGAPDILEIRARDYAARVDVYPANFMPGPIDLAATTKLTRNYAIGNILAVYYSFGALPSAEEAKANLLSMLALYRRISLSQVAPVAQTDDDSDLPAGLMEEDLTFFRDHKRVERDPKIALAVKRKKGYTCESCGLNFESMYGDIGRMFIEAHHLQPVSTLKGQKLLRDPVRDFAVLCSNCHRMIHRTGKPHDLEGLRQLIRQTRNEH